MRTVIFTFAIAAFAPFAFSFGHAGANHESHPLVDGTFENIGRAVIIQGQTVQSLYVGNASGRGSSPKDTSRVSA
ncbi:hypothetical protein [Novosphingobium terrae]|uniref:hypothetical protein n=1 Tax=Novosphingobium terrae TaxID=2726189 RepID=UPI00197EBF97|nr:hypothetical protein [Novosphingobium terrae]